MGSFLTQGQPWEGQNYSLDKSFLFSLLLPCWQHFPLLFFLLLPDDLSLVLYQTPGLGTVWVAFLLNTEFKIRHCLWLRFEFSFAALPFLASLLSPSV